MRKRTIQDLAAILFAAFLITACSQGTGQEAPAEPMPVVESVPASEPEPIIPQMQAQLEEMLDIVEQYSINRARIDWAEFRSAVLDQARGTTSLNPAIREALRRLEDGHSLVILPSGDFLAGPRSACEAPRSAPPVLPENVGYVRISGFRLSTPAAATDYMQEIQWQIKSSDSPALAGWIVDLRGNGGGAMWPMLAAIGPILGEGLAGYFIDPLGNQASWEYRDGAAYGNGAVQMQFEAAYLPQQELPRVAVLLDNLVASSGEAIAIAFRGRPDTRSFGTATCGMSTSNRSFTLSNGTLLALTVSVMADRHGTAYGGPVPVDEEIASPDEAVRRAVEWLQTGQ